MAAPADPKAVMPADLTLDPNAPTIITSAPTMNMGAPTIKAAGPASNVARPAIQATGPAVNVAPANASQAPRLDDVQFADVPLAEEAPLPEMHAAPVAPKAPPAPAAAKKPARAKKAVSWQLGAVVAAVLVIAGIAITLSWPRAEVVQPVTPPVVATVAPRPAPIQNAQNQKPQTPSAAAASAGPATASVALAGATPAAAAAAAASVPARASAAAASAPAALPTVAPAVVSPAAAPGAKASPAAAASSVAASRAAPVRPKWVQTPQPKWTTDKYRTITFELESENDVAVWMKRVRPTLAVRCLSKQTEVFVVTDTAASFEPTADRHTVRLGFDAAAPTTELWSDSADHRELFAPDGTDLAQRIANASHLQLVFTPFNASPVKVEFDVRGFAGPLQSIAKMCGPATKRAANDRPVKVADAR